MCLGCPLVPHLTRVSSTRPTTWRECFQLLFWHPYIPWFPLPTAEEAVKEKEKPKEEEREKAKDGPALECKPRPLHKTCSLFMRNIAPNISRAEIISVSGGQWTARTPQDKWTLSP